jgi:hypothetical protein
MIGLSYVCLSDFTPTQRLYDFWETSIRTKQEWEQRKDPSPYETPLVMTYGKHHAKREVFDKI